MDQYNSSVTLPGFVSNLMFSSDQTGDSVPIGITVVVIVAVVVAVVLSVVSGVTGYMVYRKKEKLGENRNY